MPMNDKHRDFYQGIFAFSHPRLSLVFSLFDFIRSFPFSSSPSSIVVKHQKLSLNTHGEDYSQKALNEEGLRELP